MKQRVELSVHTNLSAMDGVDPAERLLGCACRLGLRAIAVTDRDSVQAFPAAAKAAARLSTQGQEIRVLYGMDAGCTDGGRDFRVNVLARNREGLKNLYRLVTLRHAKNSGKAQARISKDELTAHREGLLLGSGGDEGELMQAVLSGQPWDRLLETAGCYDYLEVQPQFDREASRTIVRLGQALRLPVCATGNVYFCAPEDEILRHILHDAAAKTDADEPMPFFLRSTVGMRAEFAFLGEETAERIAVENPNRIAAQLEPLCPVPEGFFPPQIDGADERLSALVRQNAKARYGDPLPETVRARLEKELAQIAAHGYAGMYLTAQMLAADSERRGYHVLSRGAVGASLVAYFAGITDVNPLPPHYVCPRCHVAEFLPDGEFGSGFDLPEKACPKCGAAFDRDGQSIPVEVFAGLAGEKVPDIDLNLAPAYLPAAVEVLRAQFGKAQVLRGGFVRTVSPRDAASLVRRYAEKHDRDWDRAERVRLAERLCGVKRADGLHPGGWVVLPAGTDAEDFTPTQRLEADPETAATHFDLYSLAGLFRQDLLGHEIPALYRALEEATGVNVADVPLCDPEVYRLLTSPQPLGVAPEEIDCETGTLGLPELETAFMRKMLTEIAPKNFSDLVKMIGLSHGAGTWLGNAQQLLAEGSCSLRDVIALRDDVMLCLMRNGVSTEQAYEVMECVRKGQGYRLSPALRQALSAADLPNWYLESCEKIRYLFPKAHAVAYAMAAVRLGWYKIHHLAAFYAACLGARYDDPESDAEWFDVPVLSKGAAAICRLYADCKAVGDGDETERERFYHLACEAARRGVTFRPADKETAAFSAKNGVVFIPA